MNSVTLLVMIIYLLVAKQQVNAQVPVCISSSAGSSLLAQEAITVCHFG